MLIVLCILLAAALLCIAVQIRKKHMDLWLGPFFRQRLRGSPRLPAESPLHVVFCMVDHFEPIRKGSTLEEGRNRVRDWTDGFPCLAENHKDSDGRPLQHTWFYPGETYLPEHLDALLSLCKAGYGEVELHHHHYNQTSEGLRKSLLQSVEDFARHGFLTIQENGRVEKRYGFIHGDMALDNSRFDSKLCGVNDELRILKETGCYADFSSPTAPCISQTRKINSLYYATDDPVMPKSHDRGVDVRVGGTPSGDLMIIQGPLALNWRKRKMGIFPTIENPEIHSNAPGTPDRIRVWLRQHIHVLGKPDWVFVKVSCHGAEEQNYDVLLGEKADFMYKCLERAFRDSGGYRLHYVTARELFNIIKAAESGQEGNPFDFRDFLMKPLMHPRKGE